MKINIEEKKYSLDEFISNEEVSQGIVVMESRNKHISDLEQESRHKGFGQELIYAYKVYEKKTEFSGMSIIYKNLRISNDDSIDPIDFDMNFLLSINKEKHLVLYSLHYLIDVFFEIHHLKLDPVYLYLESDDLAQHVLEDQNKRVLKKLRRDIGKHTEFTDVYEEEYAETIENYKECVKNDYLSNPEVEEFENYISLRRRVRSDDLYELQKYALSEEFRDEMAEENTGTDARKVRKLAVIDAKNFLLNEIKNNPDELTLLSMEIRKKIEKGGKTLNVITKSQSVIKVENFLYEGKYFRLVKGYEKIKIENIKEITFNRRTLFSKSIVN